MTPPLVLGSTSRYRADLLRRVCEDFVQDAPGTDEGHLPDELPAARALRLAIAKAGAVAARHPGALVIGSDQVAELDGFALDKPGTAEGAREQLRRSSGRTVQFHTALCLLDARDGAEHVHVDVTRAVFRPLSDREIERYVAREQPLDCAGSFKCEGLGISLFERIETDDPTALVGLPLIALARLLRQAGHTIP
ncbi:Maf family protein [Dyella lutea]|uniref:7-methyl-GTP pyrophosphatase n=1 Tax=Dyella lutea TaxID=2950441 RepID=A0ABT1FEY6_9GAMM|nr:Maf family nucleotide pyrophosphatase [Dyella lutea]